MSATAAGEHVPEPDAGAPCDGALAAAMDQREKLLGWIMRTTGFDRATAEDVLQDVTVYVLEHGVAEEPASWLHYLAVAAKNRASNLRRQAERDERRLANADWAARDVDVFTEGIAARMLFLDAMNALAQLTERQRKVVLMHYYEGSSLREIDELLGWQPRQAEGQHREAMKRLKAIREQQNRAGACALLALVLRRVAPDNAAGSVSSLGSAVSVAAAAVALSLVTSIGAPPASSAAAERPSRAAPTVVLTTSAARPRPAWLVTSTRPAGPRIVEAGQARTPKRLPLRQPPGGHVCVGGTCLPGGDASAPADVLTVYAPAPVGDVTYREDNVPLCRYVSGQPVADCRTDGDPNYLVDPPPPSAD